MAYPVMGAHGTSWAMRERPRTPGTLHPRGTTDKPRMIGIEDGSPVTQHSSVADRLARLAPDQRTAATAPPGPVLCVAPAGSGKTTTLVARVSWLVDGGT